MTSFHFFLHAALFSSQSHVLHAPMSEPVFVSRDPVSANQEPVFVSPEPEPGSLCRSVLTWHGSQFSPDSDTVSTWLPSLSAHFNTSILYNEKVFTYPCLTWFKRIAKYHKKAGATMHTLDTSHYGYLPQDVIPGYSPAPSPPGLCTGVQSININSIQVILMTVYRCTEPVVSPLLPLPPVRDILHLSILRRQLQSRGEKMTSNLH